MSGWSRAIQIIEKCASEREAGQVASHLAEQVDFLAGRLIGPSPSKPGWRVQALMSAKDIPADSWLPDGMRHVFVTDAMLAWMFGGDRDA